MHRNGLGYIALGFVLAAAVPGAPVRAATGDAAPVVLDRLPGGREARLLAEALPQELAEGAPLALADLTVIDQAVARSVLSSRPVRLPRLSSAFGWRGASVGSEYHAGIDIPGPVGTPVIASAAGVVGRAGWAGGYGLMVELRHGSNFTTRYAHLSRLLVAPGAIVRQGQLLGLMGSTGRSTGSHLHFEVRQNGRPLDPIAILRGPGLAVASLADWPMPDIPDVDIHISGFARGRGASVADSVDADSTAAVGGPEPSGE